MYQAFRIRRKLICLTNMQIWTMWNISIDNLFYVIESLYIVIKIFELGANIVAVVRPIAGIVIGPHCQVFPRIKINPYHYLFNKLIYLY